jgi:tRNA A37 threonylcarbamoyladenosine synthetase subunit TsaC/SUA5/YrdC
VSRPDIAGDARRALETVAGGGVAIVPGNMGYGCIAATPDALRKISAAKGRSAHKRHGIHGDWQLHRELHDLDEQSLDMVDTVTLDYDLPLGVVGPYRATHPLIRSADPETLRGATVDGTVNIVVNAGRLHGEITRLGREAGILIFGSSANATGTGVKSRLQDIEQQVLDVADCVIDYGLCQYYAYRRASTLINFAERRVIRAGTCYELISDIMIRHYGWELPPDPGLEALPSGLLWEPSGR